jgi:uncharacterized protein YbjT (DUF2867 family)
MKTALIAGATGLIGKQLLSQLLVSDRYSQVKAITRHELDVNHPKLTQYTVNFNSLNQHAEELQADDVFCCLGTTISKAGSQEKFREVDYTFPLALATASRTQGAKQYLLVSALGADKKSSFFYNRVKGEVEEAITAIDFQTIHIFRPSLLLGKRTEARPGEDAAKFFYRFFGFLIPAKYQAIDATKVANAMVHFAKRDQQGIYIHESKELQTL